MDKQHKSASGAVNPAQNKLIPAEYDWRNDKEAGDELAKKLGHINYRLKEHGYDEIKVSRLAPVMTDDEKEIIISAVLNDETLVSGGTVNLSLFSDIVNRALLNAPGKKSKSSTQVSAIAKILAEDGVINFVASPGAHKPAQISLPEKD